MNDEQIEQALSQLEKLYEKGHLTDAMYHEKRQNLLGQWGHDATTSGVISRADVVVPPEELAPPLSPYSGELFAPQAEHLRTRHLQAVESPLQLSTRGIEKLVDRHTAEEIRALNARPSESDLAPLPPGAVGPDGSRPPVEGKPHKRPAHEGEGQPGFPQPTSPADYENAPPFVGDVLRGRYQLLSLLGAGGMGKVFLVEDLRFGGRYAAKVLHPWVVQHEPTISRFVQEFKMMEQLVHPGIVRTFALDEDTSTQSLYYLMEYVEGKTLQDVLERAISSKDAPPFTGEETLHFLEKLTDILRYTHGQHVLHRDLKPTNIMLYQSSDAEYGLKLLDFGLAKWLNESEDPALHTGHAGTFFYIAPEQLMGGSAALVAADVFSLGVVLYQMLTGALPVAMAVPPSEVNPELPAQIDLVMRKAMHANWQQRHQSVDELFDEFQAAFGAEHLSQAALSRTQVFGGRSDSQASIQSLLEDGPTGQESGAGRADKFSARGGEERHWSRESSPHPSPGGTGRRRSHKSKPPKGKLPSQSPSGQQRAAQVSNAERIARLRRTGRADSPLGSGTQPVVKPSAKLTGTKRTKSTSTIERIERVRTSRTSASVSTSSAPKTRSSGPRRASEPPKERQSAALQSFAAHESAGIALIVSPDGRLLASAGQDHKVHLWDTSSWFRLHTFDVGQTITAMLWSPHDDHIAIGTERGELQVWKTLSAQRAQTFTHMSPVRAMAWLPGGSHVLCGCDDASVTPWDLRSGKQERLIHSRHPNIRALSIDAGGFLLASASSTRPIKIWNLARHSLLLELSSNDNELLTSMHFSPIEAQIASGCMSGALQIWELQSGTVRYMLDEHKDAIHCTQYATNGAWLATGSEDRTVKQWEAESGRLLNTFHGHEYPVRGLCVAPDASWIASLCEGGQVKVWEVEAKP